MIDNIRPLDFPKTAGIYKIQAPSGNFYIGSSHNIRARLSAHRAQLTRGLHFNKAVQSAFNKYDGDLKATMVEECSTEDLISREQHYIDTLNPKYNQSRIAGRIEQTDESKRKKSEALKGRPKSLEHRARLSASRMGIKWTDEQKAAIAGRRLGYKHSEETKAKIGDKHRGKLVSPETREKLSIAQIQHQIRKRESKENAS